MVQAARVVMALRNPVDRAYSEYQMKARRVANQLLLNGSRAQRELALTLDGCMAPPPPSTLDATSSAAKIDNPSSDSDAPAAAGDEDSDHAETKLSSRERTAPSGKAFKDCVEGRLRVHTGFNPLLHNQKALAAVLQCAHDRTTALPSSDRRLPPSPAHSSASGPGPENAAALETFNTDTRAPPPSTVALYTAAHCLNIASSSFPIHYESLGPVEDVFEAERQRIDACSVSLPLEAFASATALLHAVRHRLQRSSGSEGSVGSTLMVPRWLTVAAEAEAEAEAEEEAASDRGGSNGDRLTLSNEWDERALRWMGAQRDNSSRASSSGRAVLQGGGLVDAPWLRDPDGAGVSGQARLLLDGFSPCFRQGSSSDIRGDFLYRGVYLNQLMRLLASFPKEQVLLVASEAMAGPEGAQRTMDALYEHAGLMPLNQLPGRVLRGEEAPDIEELMDQLYPTFSRTGWEPRGKYPPLAPSIYNATASFFQDYNRALVAWLAATLPH